MRQIVFRVLSAFQFKSMSVNCKNKLIENKDENVQNKNTGLEITLVLSEYPHFYLVSSRNTIKKDNMILQLKLTDIYMPPSNFLKSCHNSIFQQMTGKLSL